MMEAHGFQIPLLSINLMRLTTVVFQIGPGKLAAHKRPSYFMLFTPHRAWTGSTAGTTYPNECTWAGSIETMLNTISGEYDSRVYEVQSRLPVISFNRRILEGIQHFLPMSNYGMMYGPIIPCVKDVNNVETTYKEVCDSSTDIYYSPNLGGLGDDFAMWPLFRLSSNVDGGICGQVAVAQDKMSIQYVDVQAGGAYADCLSAGWTYALISAFPHLCNAMGQADDYWTFLLAAQCSTLTNVFPTATSWNQRCVAFLLKRGFLTTNYTNTYIGLLPSADVAVTPLASRMGTTSTQAEYLAHAAGHQQQWTILSAEVAAGRVNPTNPATAAAILQLNRELEQAKRDAANNTGGRT